MNCLDIFEVDFSTHNQVYKLRQEVAMVSKRLDKIEKMLEIFIVTYDENEKEAKWFRMENRAFSSFSSDPVRRRARHVQRVQRIRSKSCGVRLHY
jgi:hypothetical protein